MSRNHVSAGNGYMGLSYIVRVTLATLILVYCTTSVRAQGLIYVDARSQDFGYPFANLYQSNGAEIPNTSNNGILDPLSGGPGTADGQWHWRSNPQFGVPTQGFDTIYASEAEDAPEIRMVLRDTDGLAAATNYDVYVVYWSDRSNNWNIRAGLASGALTLFDRTGDEDNVAMAGTFASSGAWTTPPANSVDATGDDDPSPFISHTPLNEPQFSRDMYMGLVGAAQLTPQMIGGSSSNVISVFLDDLPATTVNERTWIEGLAFVSAGTPVFATGILDRDSGNLIISNPTNVNFNVASYAITSAGGALDGVQWQNITNNSILPDPDNDWSITSGTSASEVALSEADGGGGQPHAVFAAGSGAMNFGNVWRRSPIEDVQVALTLTNGQVLTIIPEYTGTEITPGDFDADGVIDGEDYLALINGLHDDFSTRALAYSGGDVNGNGFVDRNDVLFFRNVFDGANGAGSFDAMVAAIGVPEPSAAMLGALAGGLIVLARRRRRARGTQVLIERSTSSMRFHGTSAWVMAAAAAMAASFPAGTVVAVPVTGWAADPLITDGPANPIIIDPDTDHPTLGDGTPNSATQVNLFATMSQQVDLLNGKEVVLSGKVTITDIEAGANGAFRWGMFYDTMAEGRTDVTAAWNGYLASSASGGANGRLDTKNADANDWLTASHISTNSTALFSGNCDNVATTGATGSAAPGCGNRVFNLAQGGSNDEFVDGTYEFEIVVGRYGDEVTVSSSMRSVDVAGAIGDYNNNGAVDAADYVLWRKYLGQAFDFPNRAAENTGPVSAADYNAWRAGFGNTAAPGYTFNLGGGIDRNDRPAPGVPAEGTELVVTDHLTFSFNRVALFFASHMAADLAEMEDVDVSPRDIQSLTLEIDLSNNGAARFVNDSTDNFDMIYYDIISESESLVHANWTSFDDADPLPDPLGNEWNEASGSDNGVLSEVNLTGTARSFATGGSSFNLGNIFNVATGTQDLRFFFTQSDGSVVRGIVSYLGAGVGAAVVPEPGTLWLMSLGTIFAVVGRSLRQRRT